MIEITVYLFWNEWNPEIIYCNIIKGLKVVGLDEAKLCLGNNFESQPLLLSTNYTQCVCIFVYDVKQ